MASIRSKIQAGIKSGKINKFILFLTISFIILLLSKLSKDYTKTVTFDIKAINLPEEQVIIKDSAHKMDILLKTYGFKLMRYYLSNPKIAVDLEKTQNINKSYLWTALNNGVDVKAQFSDNVVVEGIQPDTIIFNYDVNYVKKVPIILLSKVNFAPGYNLKEDYVLQPDSVRLIGPRVIVAEIKEIKTDTLFMDDVKTDIEQILDLQLPEQIETIAMSSKQVTIEGDVDKFTEGTVQVPVIITNLPKNVSVNYFPKKVSVVFNTALSNYSAVEVGDFLVECDYNDLSDQSSFLVPKVIKKPDIVRSVKINQTKIEIIISQ
jgi:hypothetical protein